MDANESSEMGIDVEKYDSIFVS